MDEISDLITMPGQPALTALGEHEPRLPADSDDPQWYLNREQAYVKKYFTQVVFPVLTPLAFDRGRPFPHITNLSLNLAVLIRDPAGKERFARVKVPGTLPRLVPLRRSSGGVRKDGIAPR